MNARAAALSVDVRQLAPAQRHELIFAGHQALTAGMGFVLVNGHDPKPIRYQFDPADAGKFTWDYLDSGPLALRVRIGRTLSAGSR